MMVGRFHCRDRGNIRLGLGNVDDGTRHGADEDDAAVGLALHQVAGNGGGEEVGAIHIDGPELAHALNGVAHGIEVLGEAGGCDEVVDAAVNADDVGNALVDRLRIRDVGVVSGDARQVLSLGVLLLESINEVLGLCLGLLEVQIDNGKVTARVGDTLAHDKTKTTGTTGHDGDLVFEGEAGESRLRETTTVATDGLAARKLVFLGVFDLDVRVGTRVGSRLVETRSAHAETAGLLLLMLLLTLADEDGRAGAVRPGGADGAEGNASAGRAEHCDVVCEGI